MTMMPIIRFRIDIGAHCSVGIGKIQLLEAILAAGSLSQAARTLKMSYRRAWLLLEDMNASFKDPVASTSVGGRGGGGVELTAFGRRLIDDYRALDSEIQALAAAQLQQIVSRVNGAARPRLAPSASIKRKAAARGRR
jgi:molybdate transport system regulatory protein